MGGEKIASVILRFSSADRRTKSMICNVEWRAKKWRKMTKICEFEPHFPFDNGLFSASSGELDVHFPLWKCIISLVTDPEPPKKNCSDALACVLHAFSVVFQMCAISFQWFSFIFSCGFSCFSATFQLLFSYFSLIPWGYFWKTWSVVLVFCLKKWVNSEG